MKKESRAGIFYGVNAFVGYKIEKYIINFTRLLHSQLLPKP